MKAGGRPGSERPPFSEPTTRHHERQLRCRSGPYGAGSGQAFCLLCGEVFTHEAAMITVKAMGEWLGYIGPCCLDDEARRRYHDACRSCEAQR